MQTPTTRKARLLGQADRVLGKTASVVAVAAGAGLICEPQKAEAAFVYSGPLSINIPTTTQGVYLNLVTGVNATSPAGSPGWDINPWSTSTLSIWANNGVGGGVVSGFPGGSSLTLVDNLPIGTLVGPGSPNYTTTSNAETTGATAFNLNSVSNYAGLRFINESAGGITNFGWVQFSLGNTFAGQPRSIIAYAFDDSGASVVVGDTGVAPAPASLAIFSLGAVGLAAIRRRRNLAQAAA